MFQVENQVQDDTLQEETSQNDTDTEESSEMEADQTDWEAEAKKWKAIAERNKRNKEKPKSISKAESGTSEFEIDRKVLLAQGTDETLVDHLEKVAKLNGISMLAATKDPLYTAFKANYEQEKKVEQAQVGASKGGGTREAQKDFGTPRLSKDEHKQMYANAVKNLRL